MAELNEKKLVNAAALRDVAKGVYDQVQADIDAVEAQIEDVTKFETDMLIVTAQGGIKAGADLNGMTVQEILAKLLYPHVKPTVGSVSVTADPSTVREHGNYQKVTKVSATVNKKSNPIIKVELYKGSTLIGTKEDMAGGGTATFAGLSEETANGTKFTIKAYALNEAGTGNDVVTADSAAFTYVYPYFQGVIGEGEEITGDVIAGMTKKVEKEGTKSYSYTTNNQCAVIAFPKSYGVMTKVLDPNSFDVTATFTKYEVQVPCADGTTQAYYVYVSGASTVTNFTYKFTM